MPELPEVEAFAHYFNEYCTNKKIVAVTKTNDSLLEKISFKDFKSIVEHTQFGRAIRKGKFLIAPLKGSDYSIVFHFGMTGSFHYVKKDQMTAEDEKYGHVKFFFTNGFVLVWINKRKFGKIYLVQDPDAIATIAHLGPDALGITQKAFFSCLNDSQKSSIKSFLMDQEKISGIGNEYSNEILYQARIAPQRIIDSLSQEERKTLYMQMKSVLKQARSLRMAGKKLPPSWLLSHLKGKGKDMCCPGTSLHVKKITIGGRSAYYCPSVQK